MTNVFKVGWIQLVIRDRLFVSSLSCPFFNNVRYGAFHNRNSQRYLTLSLWAQQGKYATIIDANKYLFKFG